MKIYTILILAQILCSCQIQTAAIKQNGKYGLIDSKGKILVEPKLDYILGQSEGLRSFEIDSLWGFMNSNGNILIKPQYYDADYFQEGLAIVANESAKHGYINTKGDTIINFEYDGSFAGFSQGLSDVIRNDSCGYINRKGQIVIPLKYETCYEFQSEFTVVWNFEGDRLILNKEGKEYMYDKERFKNEKIYSLNAYPDVFQTENGRGHTNANGDTIIQANYLSTGNLVNGMYIVETKNKKWGAYKSNGKLVVKPEFDELRHFNEGVANFKINEKWGFVGKDGQIIIEPTFDYAQQFHNGLAYVELNGKAGFINKKGKVVIPIIYETYRWSKFE